MAGRDEYLKQLGVEIAGDLSEAFVAVLEAIVNFDKLYAAKVKLHRRTPTPPLRISHVGADIDERKMPFVVALATDYDEHGSAV